MSLWHIIASAADDPSVLQSYHKGQATSRHYVNQTTRPIRLLSLRPNFTSTYRGVNACLAQCLNSVLNVKTLGTFDYKKALVGAFSVIAQLHRLIVYTTKINSVSLASPLNFSKTPHKYGLMNIKIFWRQKNSKLWNVESFTPPRHSFSVEESRSYEVESRITRDRLQYNTQYSGGGQDGCTRA